MNGQIVCTKHPEKMRASRKNKTILSKKVQDLQKKYHMNFRIYLCDACNGYHYTKQTLEEYNTFNNKPKNIEISSNAD